MLKLSRAIVHRNQQAGKLLPEKFGDVKDAPWLSNFTSRHWFSTAGPDFKTTGNYSGRTFADFSIFKGKAALSATPVPPKFSKIGSGSRVEKKGVVMLTFMPAIGQRKYDYEKRQKFALSATEVGCLISLGPTESCEFFHDPSMKSSMEGQVKKTLSVSPLPGGEGYFFNLSVLYSAQKRTDRLSVHVSKAEFAVMRTGFGFALPHLLGWDRVVSMQLTSTGAPAGQTEPETRLDPDYEWGR